MVVKTLKKMSIEICNLSLCHEERNGREIRDER